MGLQQSSVRRTTGNPDSPVLLLHRLMAGLVLVFGRCAVAIDGILVVLQVSKQMRRRWVSEWLVIEAGVICPTFKVSPALAISPVALDRF
jgi:hypothetical protein